MASTIVTKNSSTASAVPVAGDLTKGELAVNVTDKKLYTKDNGGSVVKLVGGLGNQEANAVAITGGAIDGTTVGSTTTAAGAFTTLTASSSFTLSGGTANGVVYLNGSKVATSGSALTFDGTNFATTGQVISGGDLKANSTGTGNIGLNIARSAGTTADWYNYIPSGSADLVWFKGGELMRLTSTGLGIGTSSPSYKLDVSKAAAGDVARFTNGGASNKSLLVYTDATYAAIATGANASGNGIAFDAVNNQILFTTNSANRMWLDSSGNLGLGVTPSAFTGGKAMEFAYAGNGMWGTGAGDFSMLANVKYNGALQYANTGVGANRFVATGGAYQWFTAPSGTAGNAITFTQAMTLDASGNLGVGTTSPTVVSNYKSVTVNGTTGGLVDIASNGTVGLRLQCDTTYPGGAFFTLTNQPMIFGTNGSERARIDSSGNLLVGTTSAGYRVRAATSGNFDATALFENTNGSYGGTVLSVSSSRAATSLYDHINCGSDSVVVFKVLGNGNAQNTNNSYGAISDIKVKENIIDATPKLAQLSQVRVVNYNLIGDTNKQIGVVAQELEQVFPSMVEETPDRDTEGNDLGTTTKSVKYSVFVPMLIKAIQELKSELDSVKAELTTLKGN